MRRQACLTPAEAWAVFQLSEAFWNGDGDVLNEALTPKERAAYFRASRKIRLVMVRSRAPKGSVLP